MSKIEDFRRKPTKVLAPLYQNSFLHLHRAPENCTSDFLLGSLYRTLNLVPLANNEIPTHSEKFKKDLKLGLRSAFPERISPSQLDDELWSFLVNKSLSREGNTSRQKLIFLDPIIPHIAFFSAVARTTGNWNAGEFIRGMLIKGASSFQEAEDLWRNLASALSVEANDSKEDLWAVFLANEFKEWLPEELKDRSNNPENATFKNSVKKNPSALNFDFDYPAREFFLKLNKILKLKYLLTRKQWMSIFDSFLRISCVSDALWTCEMNIRFFALAKKTLEGESPSKEEIRTSLKDTFNFLKVGEHLENCLKEQCRNYAKARTGLNYIFFKLSECEDIKSLHTEGQNLNSVSSIYKFLKVLSENRNTFCVSDVNNFISEVIDSNPTLTKLDKSGAYSVNLFWFCRYILGQYTPKEESKKYLDQGFFGKKLDTYSSAPWGVDLGTNAVLAMVACCAEKGFQITSVDLREQLSKFGLTASISDLTDGNIGKQLRGLGLVIDSPDAEGGMAIRFPYNLA